jgi:hypothetical protein
MDTCCDFWQRLLYLMDLIHIRIIKLRAVGFLQLVTLLQFLASHRNDWYQIAMRIDRQWDGSGHCSIVQVILPSLISLFLNSYRNSIPINFSASAIRSFPFRSFRSGGSIRQHPLMLQRAVPLENINVITNTGTSVTALMLRTGVVSASSATLCSASGLHK